MAFWGKSKAAGVHVNALLLDRPEASHVQLCSFKGTMTESGGFVHTVGTVLLHCGCDES